MPNERAIWLAGLFCDSGIAGNGFIAANTQFDDPGADAGRCGAGIVVLYCIVGSSTELYGGGAEFDVDRT